MHTYHTRMYHTHGSIYKYSLVEAAEELARPFSGFSESAMDRLRMHPWPGNVRELRNVVERAAIVAGAGLVGPEQVAQQVAPVRE